MNRDRNTGWLFKDKTLLPGQGHDWQAHDFAVVTLVVFGRLDEGFAHGTQECGSWELHYKPKGALHTTATGPEGTRMLLLRLGDSALRELDIPGTTKPRVLGGGVHSARVLAALLNLRGAGAATACTRPEAIAGLWRELSRRISPPRETPTRRPEWIRQVHRRIRSEQGDRRSLDELAAQFEVHPVYLARAFRRHYGRSIGDSRRRVRIERSVRRLTTSNVDLSELALDLGYADQAHFTREFKRETGWTPARFRDTAVRFGRLEPLPDGG